MPDEMCQCTALTDLNLVRAPGARGGRANARFGFVFANVMFRERLVESMLLWY